MLAAKRISFFILLLNSILMAVYGIGIIVNPGLIIAGLEKYSTSIFTNQNTLFQKYIIMLIRLLGCFNIVAAISGIIAIAGYEKSKSLKYLAIIFFCNTLAYGCSVAFDLTTGIIGIIEVVEIGIFFLSLIAFAVLAYDYYKTSKQ